LIIDCVEGIAAVAGSQANADRAATLWGAVERLREAARIPDTGVGDAFYGRYRTATRAQLGESAWAAAWVSGQAMTLDQAVAFALATAEPVPPGVLGESVVGPQPSILTPREHEVAILVARGLTNHQIASELGMAQRTADTHVSHILHKLGLASRARVRDWAEAHGLPPADCR
jgi:non-specific serine/threonine protein kinase